MDLVKDRKGQVNIIRLVITAIVGLILLAVFFGIFVSVNRDQFDTTSLLLTGFFGTLISLVIFIGIINSIA